MSIRSKNNIYSRRDAAQSHKNRVVMCISTSWKFLSKNTFIDLLQDGKLCTSDTLYPLLQPSPMSTWISINSRRHISTEGHFKLVQGIWQKIHINYSGMIQIKMPNSRMITWHTQIRSDSSLSSCFGDCFGVEDFNPVAIRILDESYVLNFSCNQMNLYKFQDCWKKVSF